MFIRRDRPEQWIAGYCPFCRDVGAFRLFAPPGPTVRLLEECECCGIRYLVEPDSFLNVCDKKPPLKELIERTRPHLPAWTLKRIAFDRSLVAQEADPVQRATELRSCFSAVEYMAKPRRGGELTLKHTAMTLVLIVGGAGFALLVGVAVEKAYVALTGRNLGSDSMPFVIFAAFVVWVAAILFAVRRVESRRIRAQLIRALSRVLRPLRPSDEELADVASWLRASRSPLARHVRMPIVAASMRKLSDVSLQNVDELGVEAWGKRILADHAARQPDTPRVEPEEPDPL